MVQAQLGVGLHEDLSFADGEVGGVPQLLEVRVVQDHQGIAVVK